MLPTWTPGLWRELQSLFQGADERILGDATAAGISTSIAAGVAGLASLASGSGFGGTSTDYSVAALAVRYIHESIGGGISTVMTNLAGGATLQSVLDTVSGGTTLGDFETAFRANIGGIVLDAEYGNADTGAIGGSDVDGGAVLDASSVINNTESPQANPTNFNVVFPLTFYSNEGPTEYLDFQIGANEGETIKIAYAAASTKSLGISDVDLRKEPGTAITKLDNAIIYISKQRARLGAQQNRLESAINVNAIAVESLSASRSRIKDTDYAVETAELTKGQILQQAATAMMGQALATPSLTLQLLSQF